MMNNIKIKTTDFIICAFFVCVISTVSCVLLSSLLYVGEDKTKKIEEYTEDTNKEIEHILKESNNDRENI